MYMRFGALSLAAWLAFSPTTVVAAWQTVFTEQGKSIEIDKDSIKLGEENGIVTARGRIVMEKPIVDPKTSAAYRIIEVEDRFNCAERTLATHKRSYFKEENDLLRMEEVRSPFDMPVRSGSPDENCSAKRAVHASPAPQPQPRRLRRLTLLRLRCARPTRKSSRMPSRKI